MKWHIQYHYRGDRHWVWCGEHADCRTADPASLAALTPPSSNPAEIYADLRAAVARTDRHNAKIRDVRDSYTALTSNWVADGSMTSDQRDEVISMMTVGDIRLWRPVLYVIPRHLISPTRLKTVDPSKRAGPGPEFIIKDLSGEEFERVELP